MKEIVIKLTSFYNHGYAIKKPVSKRIEDGIFENKIKKKARRTAGRGREKDQAKPKILNGQVKT
jgi:hypothetical protein